MEICYGSLKKWLSENGAFRVDSNHIRWESSWKEEMWTHRETAGARTKTTRKPGREASVETSPADTFLPGF